MNNEKIKKLLKWAAAFAAILTMTAMFGDMGCIAAIALIYLVL